MKQVLRSCVAVLSLVAIFAVDCAAKKNAKSEPDPVFMAIQNISVLPIVDARAGKKAGVNLEKLQQSVAKVIKKKRYSVSSANIPGEAGEIAVEDVEAADPSYVKKLGPTNERWVMVVFLDDITSKITFGSTGNAELSGYLFDKQDGRLVWKNKGVGQAGQGGLAGMAMKGMMKGEAMSNAIGSLLSSIPKRPK